MDAVPSRDDGKTPPPKWMLWLLVLPVLVHTGLVSWSVHRADNKIEFGRLDLLFFVAVVGFCCAAVFLARRRAWTARFLMLFYSSLITVLAVDLVLGQYVPVPGEGMPWTPQHRIYNIGENFDGLTNPVELTVNSMGLRGPEVRLQDMDLRIMCIGGSTCECGYVSDKLTWPWRLQDQLAEKLGKKVFVGNAGRASMFTLHHDYVIRHYDKTHLFDWVVVLCGFNDMGAHINRVNYDARVQNVPEESLQPSYGNALYYRRSALLRVGNRARMLWGLPTVVQDDPGEWMLEQRRARKQAMQTELVQEVPPAALQKALAIYEKDLQSIIRTCVFKRVKLVMLTQPTIWRTDLPEDLQRLLSFNGGQRAYSLPALVGLMDAFNKTMIRVCRENGTDCVDLAALLPKDRTVFYDDVHFNNPGCEQVAKVLTEFFVRKYATRPTEVNKQEKGG